MQHANLGMLHSLAFMHTLWYLQQTATCPKAHFAVILKLLSFRSSPPIPTPPPQKKPKKEKNT